MERQLANLPSVIRGYGQQMEADLFNSCGQIVGRVELAEGGLDRNLPERCGADQDLCIGTLNCRCRLGSEARIVQDVPKQDVAIDE